MSGELIRSLIVNVSFLLVLSILFNTFFESTLSKNKFHEILRGVIIGFLGILLMMNTVSLSTGVIFDTRSILISAAGMFFGYIPTIIATAILCIYRAVLGGDGAFTGMLVTVLSASIGLIWHRFRINELFLKKKKPWLEFYLFGLATHLVMLICMFTLPAVMISDVLKAMALPVLILYPIGSLGLCLVMYAGVKNNQIKFELEESELRFRTLVDGAPIGISISKDNHMFYVNSMYEKMLGRSKAEIIDLGWEKITHPDDLQKDVEQYELMRQGEINTYSMVKRYIRADETIVWGNMVIASLNIGNGEGQNNLCMVQDISDIIKTNENLKASETKYKILYYDYENRQLLLLSLLNSIKDLIFYKDPEGIYLGCNEAFEKFVGKGREHIVGFTDYDLFDREMAKSFREYDVSMMKKNRPWKNEEYVSCSDGSKIWLETLKSPFNDLNGNAGGLIGVSRDITERKEKEKEILYLNYHDILTGLHNRTYYEKEKVNLDKDDNLPLSVILGDINGLKLINDAFGHAEGDKLLSGVAGILSRCCEEECLLARTGGDEFTMLLPKTSSAGVKLVVNKIKKACEDYASIVGNEIYYTSISLGEETKEKTEEILDKTIKAAEESMNRAKLLESKSMHSSVINSIKTTLFEKSSETERHDKRIGDLCRRLGEELGISNKEQINLELVATLHDIGKIGIDRNILEKKEKLSTEDWNEIKKHPEIGYRIAQTVTELRSIADYILCHHERWDGLGYPQGLKGEKIPYLARVLSVADSYDAMTEDRSYRKAMTSEAAVKEIMEHAGTQFDPAIAKIFVEKVLVK